MKTSWCVIALSFLACGTQSDDISGNRVGQGGKGESGGLAGSAGSETANRDTQGGAAGTTHEDHPTGAGGASAGTAAGAGAVDAAGGARGGSGGSGGVGNNPGRGKDGGKDASGKGGESPKDGGRDAYGKGDASGKGDALARDGGAGSGDAGLNDVGARPPMGWNSWNKFGCNGLNEKVVKGQADAFVSTGMRDVGYQYVNLDDCWMDGRDSSGRLKWSSSKFPSGIPALAEYIHNKGLKIGIYETPNTQTCAALYGGYAAGVGSLGHEKTDAETFASWGIDYLKYDKCRGQLGAFAVMRDALRATGRPIFYSINPADQGPFCTPSNCSINLAQTANMWRVGFDIAATWSEVVRLIDANKNEYAGAGPGHWNDPDMLEVGNGLNDTEGRAHFSMWAIMAAPLITGNDLTTMSAATKATLTNAEVIAVDQDPLGKQGRIVATPGANLEVWSKELSEPNTRAVALFNRGSAKASMTVRWSEIGLPAGPAMVRDLWSHTDLGSFSDSYSASSVSTHSVVMVKISSAQ